MCLWVLFGIKGLEYCVGGLEKLVYIGVIFYDLVNYEEMVVIWVVKVKGIVKIIFLIVVDDFFGDVDVFVFGWGFVYGLIIVVVC